MTHLGGPVPESLLVLEHDTPTYAGCVRGERQIEGAGNHHVAVPCLHGSQPPEQVLVGRLGEDYRVAAVAGTVPPGVDVPIDVAEHQFGRRYCAGHRDALARNPQEVADLDQAGVGLAEESPNGEPKLANAGPRYLGVQNPLSADIFWTRLKTPSTTETPTLIGKSVIGLHHSTSNIHGAGTLWFPAVATFIQCHSRIVLHIENLNSHNKSGHVKTEFVFSL